MTTDGGIILGHRLDGRDRPVGGAPGHRIQRIHERLFTNRFYSAATAHDQVFMHDEDLVGAIEGHIPAAGRSSAIAGVGMPIAAMAVSAAAARFPADGEGS